MSTEAAIQALLDPDYKIERVSHNAAATIGSYYCYGKTLGKSKSGWTDITLASTDATNATAIRDNLAY